jgi:hypothetical protein
MVFFDRKEMTLIEADHANQTISNGTKWILQPNE